MRRATPRMGRHSLPTEPESLRRAGRRPSRASRRFVAVTLAVLGVAGFGIASAAQLNLTGSQISAGSTLISSCQTSGTITVAFPATWTTAPTLAYRVSTVTLSNVSAACNNRPFRLQLLNNGGTAVLGTEVTGPSLGVDASGKATIAVGSQLASDVGGIALVIQG